MLRATLYCVFQQRAIPYTRDITIVLTSPHLLIHILLPCSGVGKLFERRTAFEKSVAGVGAHSLRKNESLLGVEYTHIHIKHNFCISHSAGAFNAILISSCFQLPYFSDHVVDLTIRCISITVFSRVFINKVLGPDYQV